MTTLYTSAQKSQDWGTTVLPENSAQPTAEVVAPNEPQSSKRSAALLESGELDSPMSTCARRLFGQEISNTKD
jgi:hypothetical protein